nr:unnamed protein product [Spirometra erinaceieuropaei]
MGVAHRPEATIRRQLMQPKDPIPINRKSGVIYRIDGNCGQASYVGETGKQVRTRLHEHELAVRRKDNLSLVAAHASSPGHVFDFGNVRTELRACCRKRGIHLRTRLIDISICQSPIKHCVNKSTAQLEVNPGRVKPPADYPYPALKAEILRLDAISDRQRYHQLIKEESLGERKPSELLRRMRTLLGDMEVDEKLVKEMFLERLPADVQTILASGSQDLTLSHFAEVAERMIEVQRFQPPSVAQISTSSPTVNEQLLQQMSAVVNEIASLKLQLARITCSRSPSRNRSPEFDLLVDCRRSYLLERTTVHSVRGLTPFNDSCNLSDLDTGIACPYRDLLLQHPNIIKPQFRSGEIQHDVVHHICTSGPPVFARPRRLAPSRLQAAKAEFEHMLQLGIIRPSESPWASPMHMVPKATSDDWRPCGDYRALNIATIPDRYPVPPLQDFAGALFGKSVFSKIDLVRAFH